MDKLKLLGSLDLFSSLNQDQLNKVLAQSEELALKAGDTIIQEGDSGKECFIILKGSAEVLKHTHDGKEAHRVAVITEGNPIGEIAFVDSCPRSATVKAMNDIKLLGINIDAIKNEPGCRNLYTKVIVQCGQQLANRLRNTNQLSVDAMQRELAEAKKRIAMGIFMVAMFYIMALYTISLGGIHEMTKLLPSTTFVSLILILVFASSMLWIMKRSGYALAEYGLTFSGGWHSIKQAIGYTVPILLFIVLLKWVVISLSPDLTDRSIFTPSGAFNDGAEFQYTTYFAALIGYVVFVPLQEFVARAGLQSSLHNFLGMDSKKQIWSAILLSNLLFAMGHSHTSIGFALISFIPGVFWGWMFSKQKNLLGIIASHIMIGVWGIFIVGFEHIV